MSRHLGTSCKIPLSVSSASSGMLAVHEQASLELNLSTKKTRKQVFLQEVDKVAPWPTLQDLIAPYYSDGRTGVHRSPSGTALRLRFIQQWFNLPH